MYGPLKSPCVEGTGVASTSQVTASTSALTCPNRSSGLFLRWTPTSMPR